MATGVYTPFLRMREGGPSRGWARLRKRLSAADERVASAIGLPLSDFVERLPTFLRGSLAQTIASYRKPAAYQHRGAPAVLLVPGLFCTPSVFNRLGKALERLGADVYLPRPAPYYHGILANTGRLQDIVDRLLEDLERLRTVHGVEQVTMVGHSLGGVAALWAFAKAKERYAKRGKNGHLDNLPMIHGVALMATPFHGAPIARLLRLFIPACRDLSPGSDFLAGLQPAAGDIRFAMVAGFDSLVPRLSQMPPRADTVMLAGYQHMDFFVGTEDQVDKTARRIMETLPETGPLKHP